MPALFVACTDLSPLRTYFYKIIIFLFLQASKPPRPQASKPQYASAGDAKRKQSAARRARQACQTAREAKHADMHVPFGHADMHVRHDFSHVLVGGMQSGGRRNHQNRCIP